MALPGNKNFSDYDNYITDQNPTTSAQAQDYFRNQAELLKAVIDCDFWQPETVYQPGDVVKSDSMPNGTEAVMVATKASVTSNIEPQWGAVGGANITDGACFWKLRWQHWSKDVEQITDLTTGATNRLPNTSYAVGNVVYDRSNLSVALKCTQAGTTSADELDISNVSVGESVEDGSVVWQVMARDTLNALPLSGGVVSGKIITTESSGAITRVNGTEFMQICGGSEQANGASLLVFGKDFEPEVYGGGFEIRTANLEDGTWKALTGKQDGSLLWAGEKLAINGALSMPSDNFVSVSLEVGGNYMAPCDGWLYAESYPAGQHAYISFTVSNGISPYVLQLYKATAYQPLKKGDTIHLKEISNNSIIRFYYAQSEV